MKPEDLYETPTPEEIAEGQTGVSPHRTEPTKSAVVALSGGQDSTVCLYYARARYGPVHAVSFDYGQRHRVELEAAERIAETACVKHTILKVDALGQMADAGLTNPEIDIKEKATGTGNSYAADRGLPSSFVPGRNLILLGLAAAYGLPRDLAVLVTGVCQEDRAGYPDCRGEFVRALELAIRSGMDSSVFRIDAPLLNRSKVETWQMAHELDCLDVVIEESHTCYEGDHTTRHEWGFGCGRCPACKLRGSSFKEWRVNAETSRPIFPGAH
jgi:7-cyano-7-deazaguanine synthase